MKLWTSDDQMPSCQKCLDGKHEECVDLLWSDEYGMYACGCRNQKHKVQSL